MKVYLEFSALWASVYPVVGSRQVHEQLRELLAPFPISHLHQAQIAYLLNAKNLDRKNRDKARHAKATWRQNLDEEVFQPTVLKEWEQAYAMVVQWQADKLVIESPHVMVHVALAFLNNFDTFVSISSQARSQARELGMKVLPATLR